jgi:hypothetical protein
VHKYIISSATIILISLFIGCAHPIVITPDVSQLDQPGIIQINSNVGYVISDADREKSIETPGGGGDKVHYFPYKELEPAIFKVLSNVFQRAYPMKSQNDAQILKSNNIVFVFIPIIQTDSSSTGIMTWPPTDFKVDLGCKAINAEGQVVWEKHFTGQGQASFSEFKTDFPLAAKRASLKALQDFQKDLNTAPEFHK